MRCAGWARGETTGFSVSRAAPARDPSISLAGLFTETKCKSISRVSTSLTDRPVYRQFLSPTPFSKCFLHRNIARGFDELHRHHSSQPPPARRYPEGRERPTTRPVPHASKASTSADGPTRTLKLAQQASVVRPMIKEVKCSLVLVLRLLLRSCSYQKAISTPKRKAQRQGRGRSRSDTPQRP